MWQYPQGHRAPYCKLASMSLPASRYLQRNTWELKFIYIEQNIHQSYQQIIYKSLSRKVISISYIAGKRRKQKHVNCRPLEKSWMMVHPLKAKEESQQKNPPQYKNKHLSIPIRKR
jgi:hypothetical protein